MVLSELPNWITDAGSLAAAIAAVAVVLGLVTRARPIRWVWRQLVGEPVGRWLGGIVADRVDPVRAEVAGLRSDLGVNSVDLKDLRNELVTHMGAEEGLRADDLAERESRQQDLDAKLEAMTDKMIEHGDRRDEKIADVKADVQALAALVEPVLAELAAGNPEVRRPPEEP